MIYSVLLVFVARLLILCQALPQASADSDEVSSTEKVKDWPAVPDPVIEADYLSFKNPAEESELQNVTAKDTLADRAEIVAVWSRNSRRTDTDGVEIINIDEQMYAFFLEEYKGTELIRRYINHGTVSQWDGDDVSSDMVRTFRENPFLYLLSDPAFYQKARTANHIIIWCNRVFTLLK